MAGRWVNVAHLIRVACRSCHWKTVDQQALHSTFTICSQNCNAIHTNKYQLWQADGTNLLAIDVFNLTMKGSDHYNESYMNVPSLLAPVLSLYLLTANSSCPSILHSIYLEGPEQYVLCTLKCLELVNYTKSNTIMKSYKYSLLLPAWIIGSLIFRLEEVGYQITMWT